MTVQELMDAWNLFEAIVLTKSVESALGDL